MAAATVWRERPVALFGSGHHFLLLSHSEVFKLSQFPPAFDYIMQFEDPEKYCAEVPDAPAGARAISGINSAAWPLDFDKIAALPQSDRLPAVQAFYEANFWTPLLLGGLESQDVANRVLDEAVNAGPHVGAILLQDAINCCGQTPPLAPDGEIGPLTLDAANALDSDRLVAAYRVQRVARYNQRVARNPQDAIYLKTWLKRANA